MNTEKEENEDIFNQTLPAASPDLARVQSNTASSLITSIKFKKTKLEWCQDHAFSLMSTLMMQEEN